MITRKKVEERLMRLDPVEQMLKDAYENGQDMNALPKGRGHIANADYDLSREKNIQITKHCRYAPGRMHDHEFIEISCVFSGACHHDIMIRGQRASLDLREGNVLIIPPGTMHEISVFDDSVVLNILINRHTFHRTFLPDLPGGNMLQQFFQNIIFSEEESSYLLFPIEPMEDLKEILLQLIVEKESGEKYASGICEHLLGIFFLKIIASTKKAALSDRLPREVEQVAPMILYIQQHYRDFSLKDMAAHFHYSSVNVNRIFRKYTGNTALQYAREIRLQEGERLVAETEKPVAEIAAEIGYQDVSYFIEQFKARYGKTPLQYRGRR
ncbi:MAG: helix-turn-helix domain-containing protein [Lachnospiraceae bacterium]